MIYSQYISTHKRWRRSWKGDIFAHRWTSISTPCNENNSAWLEQRSNQLAVEPSAIAVSSWSHLTNYIAVKYLLGQATTVQTGQHQSSHISQQTNPGHHKTTYVLTVSLIYTFQKPSRQQWDATAAIPICLANHGSGQANVVDKAASSTDTLIRCINSAITDTRGQDVTPSRITIAGWYFEPNLHGSERNNHTSGYGPVLLPKTRGYGVPCRVCSRGSSFVNGLSLPT